MSVSNLFEEYAKIRAEKEALELKEEQLKPFIIQMMIEEGEDKKDIGVGKFSVSQRKTWTYPEEVVELGETFKAAKAKAESTGDATFEETPSLRYTPTKL